MSAKKPSAKTDRVLTDIEARQFHNALEREELIELREWTAAATEQLFAMHIENMSLKERIEALERELEAALSSK